MFIAHELIVDLACGAAQARLVNLVGRGDLSGPSQAAYEQGLERALRVGPFGHVPGVSKLVRVRFLDPVYREDGMTVGLRWEAAGATGGMFPVLDADISLAPAGEGGTRLGLAGSYRAPLGRLGAGLDLTVLHHAATATIRSLLAVIAGALASPAVPAGPATAHRQRARPEAAPS